MAFPYHRIRSAVILIALYLLVLTACNEDPAGLPSPTVTITDSPAATPTEQTVAMVEEENPAADVEEEATATRPEPTDTPSPTAIPEPEPKVLTVCMAAEPADLYLYGVNMLVQQGVLHGIYENLYTNLGYAYQAQGLEKLPRLHDGDATIEQVLVTAGDRVIDDRGEVVLLAEGIRIEDAEGNVVEFDGEPVMMNQMVVEFTFKPLVWEDGTPVTAEDSVFSFEIARDPDNNSDPVKTERTASYEAQEERIVRWTGIPGWMDREYFLNVWTPLPKHAWGEYSPSELATTEEVLRQPLANGPFRVAEWIPGQEIRLVRNEHYYRAEEGFPLVDEVVFLFLVRPELILSGLMSGSCDIGYQDGIDISQLDILLDADAEGSLNSHIVSSPIFEHLDFGIQPVESYAATRPDWFGDARVRQGIAHCINRQTLLELVYLGQGEVLHAYVPAEHPLFPEDGQTYAYDPVQGNALLDQAGFQDTDGDGVRDDGAGTPFAISLGTTLGAELRPQIADSIIADLAACGLETTVTLLPGEEFFAEGPAGPLFGRRFDLAIFAWVMHTNPACESYETREIPGPLPDFPAGWTGVNVTGWSTEAFDAACEMALEAFPGTAEYEAAHQEALRIFMAELPSLPLFTRLKVAATRPGVINYHLDATQPSEMWNLFELAVDEAE